MDSIPVVIVGAGPTGLALACGLLASDVPVRVVDRAAGPAGTSRALGLQPRGAEVLDRLGALGDLPARSLPIQQIVITVDGHELGRLPVGRPTPLVRRPGLLCSQTEIESALRARLAELGGAVEWEQEVTALTPCGDGVDVCLGGAEHIRAGWVVGCDGAHSAVRKAAGIGFPGVPLVERFLLADVHADLGLPRDSVAVWLRGAEMVAAFPLPGADLWRLMAPAPGDGGGDNGQEAVLGALCRLVERHSGAAPVVTGCDWTSVFRIHRRLAEDYRRGRVLLAGDAAHVHSPTGGQGMNTGIGDAENLAWKLALVVHGRAADTLLDTYAGERRPVATEVLAATSSLTELVLGRSRTSRMLRDHVLVRLLNLPLVQRLVWEQASQLKVSYRGGPLAPGRRWARGRRAGDRVADVTCARQDGGSTRLHAELGARWVLLAPPTPPGEACASVARQLLGAERVTRLVPVDAGGAALLVRPDGHLAWAGRDPAALRRWLAGVLGDPMREARPVAGQRRSA